MDEMKSFSLFAVVVLVVAAAFADGAAGVESVTVKTKAPHNQEAAFWYHVPSGYDAARKHPYPVLVYFGGRNCKGKAEASGKLGWSDWADANGVFLVCPGFQDDNYWEPEKWSGQALLDALAAIKRKYRIDDSKLLYYGYSAGSQAANLFPAWRPSRTRAWVSHACGVFHEPSSAMRGVPEGVDAAVIGVVVADHPGMVTIRTIVGSERIVDMLVGEQLPRIC
jgi:poly(3-hydroxybutyrate) depolymerase